MKKGIKIFISLVVACIIVAGIVFFGSGKIKAIFAKKENGISITTVTETELNSESELSSVKSAIGEDSPKTEPSSEGLTLEKKTEQTSDKETVKASEAKSYKLVQKLVSFGFQKSTGRNIKAIIIHTSYNNLGGDVFDFNKVLQEWKEAGVSPHYAIDRSGTIYQLVADQNIAWHAGASKLPDGTTDVNGASIGIEVVNSQNSKFSDAQYSALNSLIANLKSKYQIKYILGHDQIAPGRKTDPWGIEWSKVKK